MGLIQKEIGLPRAEKANRILPRKSYAVLKRYAVSIIVFCFNYFQLQKHIVLL
jgi:hypothetical protein